MIVQFRAALKLFAYAQTVHLARSGAHAMLMESGKEGEGRCHA